MPVLAANVRSVVAQAVKDVMGGVFDAQDGNGIVCEMGDVIQFTMEIVKTEAGLEVASTRTDNLTQTNTPDTEVGIVVTEAIGAGTDSESSTQVNSGGQTQQNNERTDANNNNNRRTSTGGGDTTTQDRTITPYGTE